MSPYSILRPALRGKTIKLDEEWSELMEQYRDDHSHPLNQACHQVGIPMILASIPVGATVVGLPLAAGLFALGWTFQFAGHAFEGKRPSFVDDRRFTLVGLLWWLKKSGLAHIEETPTAA